MSRMDVKPKSHLRGLDEMAHGRETEHERHANTSAQTLREMHRDQHPIGQDQEREDDDDVSHGVGYDPSLVNPSALHSSLPTP